jgi:signal peptidase I
VARRWLWWPVAGVVVSLLLPVATVLVASMSLGWRFAAVQSGSMEPIYPVGSLMAIRPIDPSEVRVGMPLAFVPDDGRPFVTHRVIEVREGPAGLEFRTQGDANVRPDPEIVPARAVRGRAAWAIPQLGRIVGWLAWPRGFLMLFVAPGVALVLSELWLYHRHGGPRTPVGRKRD